jgi:hypothetical protein
LNKLRGSHLDDGCRDRQRVLGVILRAEKAVAPSWGLCGDRLNGRELVGGHRGTPYRRVERLFYDYIKAQRAEVESMLDELSALETQPDAPNSK